MVMYMYITSLLSFTSFDMERNGTICRCYTNVGKVPSTTSYTENTIQIQTPSVQGCKDWFVNSVTIAPGSAEQGFEGRHYFWSMCLH